MAEQTAKSDVRNGLRNDIPKLQSMLAKLNLKHKHPKTDCVKLHPETACKSVFYHSLEPEEGIKNEEDRKDSKVRSDEEQATRISETKHGNEAVEEVKELPDAFPKWERKSLLPDSMSIETQVAELSCQPRESESLEDKMSKEKEEHVAGAALVPNNQSQETSAHTSLISVSSDKVNSAQVGLKHEPLDEACGGPSKPVSMDTSRVLTHQTAVNVRGKTTRSASDPVARKPKEERPLSAPSISNLREYEKYEDFTNAMPAKSISKAAKYSGMSIGNVEQDNSLTKTQKKGVKNKMKNLTQKLMVKFKDKHDCEHTGSKSTQDSVEEEEGQNLKSMEVEAEAQDIPPPLPAKMGKYVFLDRRFTLKDFKLNLEPINLMEEIFAGSEWLSYLPIKESPAEKDTSDQSMTNDVLQPEKDIQLDAPLPTPEQDQSEDTKTPEQDQSEDIKTPEEDQSEDTKTPEEDQSEDIKDNQDSVSDPQEDNVAKANSDLDVKQVERDANIFAIPKALLTNNAIQQRARESYKSDDIYDCVDMYIIPKNDFPLMKRKASDAPLDFSVVKSFELLDNSALKSRIRLSKRHHQPPKKHKKVKTETLSAIFYKIPPVILNESPVSTSPPRHSIPFSTSPPLRLPSHPYHF
ncbi:uncharacterized protein si:dkey-9i23.6 [Onychostoma macrolepis]|uniref:Uncharacterized protein n=1 Tax=Onychostoma macrolepis TaxID=369639 RepID=A0A7J6DIB1_9TELE|nr:uncharacterized protein si:dkey-9i23.6 [Onychostoma macrolepis]KAF4118534.1 hypothetical protein G5714_000585 [Onychostoma macrolepis]